MCISYEFILFCYFLDFFCFNFMCMGIFACICLSTVCVQCPMRPEEGIVFSRAGVTEGR